MTTQVAARVAAHPFFVELSTEQLAVLADGGTAVSFPAGRRIFAEGGVADRFWLIESGSVALDMRMPGRGDRIVETLTGRTVLGWSWLCPPYRWHFGAVAREPSMAIEFDAAALHLNINADPAFGYAVLRSFTPVIIKRLQATRLRMLDLYASPEEARRTEAILAADQRATDQRAEAPQ